MTKQVSYLLIIASAALLIFDFYRSGLNFDNGRIFKNISSVLLIILSIVNLRNLKSKS